ncbi:MAG TPA: endo-1,4-beta-xylanase, partial [Verrucomicrobiae bacterium]|nr:endo-1,4-beta-xylanase [Verrucomicrobiae bacterium]
MKTKTLFALTLMAGNAVAIAQTNSPSDATNAPSRADAPTPAPILQIDAGKVTGSVSPMLYGLMTEEINFSYEGGIYAELIRNRTFKANAQNPVFWKTVGETTLTLDTNRPLNAALNVSLKLDTSKASKPSPVGIANDGYWGIPVRPNTTYRASFYARGRHFSGPLTVSLESTNGQKIFAQASVPGISGEWKKYDVALTTGNVEVSRDNRLAISTTRPGTFFHRHGMVWFQNVSLFPPTYNNRPNGTRPDIMQLLADMDPRFLRFPGGNYVEGNTIAERFDWKETIGDVSRRPGHRSPWGYWSTDGFGLLEFLEWCEDLHMQPVLAVYAGYSLRQQHVDPGTNLVSYVQDALDEIEYVTGKATTRWGAQRVKDGHPAPFTLNYVEIGNEDSFDRSHSYDGRFAQFYDAIKAKYPNLQVIATTPVKSRVPDVLDEHYYRSQEDMQAHALDYDKYSRADPAKIFVGEWATRVGSPTPNMAGALGDAAWMTGMERNSDIVVMSCYAPLFVNVSQLAGANRSMQWGTDLIGYDALTSYGSPAYYAQKMFSTLHGDEILATDSQNMPTRQWQPGMRRGVKPPPQQIRQLFFDATRGSRSGILYLKVVNEAGTARRVDIQIAGAPNIQPEGEAVSMAADSPGDTNSLEQPRRIVPRTEKADNLGTNFTRDFPPYSITVLKLNSKRSPDISTLRNAYKNSFYVGVAINRTIATGAAVRADNVSRTQEQVEKDITLVKDQFNQIAPENDLKWALIHPREGADGYNFGTADAFVNFGVSNHLYIVGHTLVWHAQTPNWVFAGTNPPPGITNATPIPIADTNAAGTNGPGRGRFGPGFGGGFGRFGYNGPRASREELLQRMRDHIHTVVGRYKGKIKVWDVVNEAVADRGTNILRNSLWLQIIGPDFIARAFEYAHEADPDAILRYNDYGLESPTKRRKFIALVKSLQEQHVPVMAIGSQTHVSVSSPSFEAEDAALTDLEQLGLPIHITELDVNSARAGQRDTGADVANNAATTQGGLVVDADQRLADQYANLFRAFLKHRASVKVVTFWGVNDGVSWRVGGRPL